MSLTTLYILTMVFERLSTIIFLIGICFLVYGAFICISSLNDYDMVVDDGKLPQFKSGVKKVIIAGILVMFSILLPSKKDILVTYSLCAVDEVLKNEHVIKIGDNLVKIVEEKTELLLKDLKK